MIRRLPIIAALLVIGSVAAQAQTINGESNYEDGLSHIPPQPDEPAKAKAPADVPGQRSQSSKPGMTGSK